MVNYTCSKCNKIYTHKGNYLRHINKKNSCINIINNGNINEKKNLDSMDSKKSINLFELCNTMIQNSINNTNIKKSIKKKIFNCKYCNKDFSTSSNLSKHIKKNRCKVLKEMNKVESNEKKMIHKKQVSIIKKQVSQKVSKNQKQVSQNWENLKEVSQKSSKINIYICEFCNKNFKNHKNNYYRHMKHYCKVKKKLEDKERELEEAKKEIDQLKRSQHVTYNNNITLIAHNKQPDLSHLTNKDYVKIMNRGFNSVPKLIEAIHFNPKKPENHNVYIPNIKNKYAMVWNGNKWELNNQDDVIEDMYEENSDILIDKLEELCNNPKIRKKFKRFIDKKEEYNIRNKIKEDIKLLLYNNKNLVKIKS